MSESVPKKLTYDKGYFVKSMRWSIVVHGGAGTFNPEDYTDAELSDYKKVLTLALEAGAEILKFQGHAIEAVCAAVCVLENSALFNAGKGSVFSHHGKNEMDASVMNGLDLNSGAVSGVERIKNPILAAKAVLDHSEHRFFAGEGAQVFARKYGVASVDPSYFVTGKRWTQMQKNILQNKVSLDHQSKKMGTVGAVAFDGFGNLAAATSTGGLTNKAAGRVSDSSIIGAGTYANNQSIALSATGTGDVFIKLNLAYDVHAQMYYQKVNAKDALANALTKLKEHGGNGGFIGIDKDQNIHMPFISTGMFRGFKTSKGELEIKVFS